MILERPRSKTSDGEEINCIDYLQKLLEYCIITFLDYRLLMGLLFFVTVMAM